MIIMAKKEFKFYGKTLEEVKKLSEKEFMKLLPARQRRSLKRGRTEAQKKLMKKIRKGEDNIRTHCRNTVVIPEMLGKAIKVYNGQSFVDVRINKFMLGHFLGEFAHTRSSVDHSAPGIGVTRSSAAISVR